MPEKSVADKLLIKSGYRVRFINPPEGLDQLLGQRPASIEVSPTPDQLADLLLVFFNSRLEMEAQLDILTALIKPGGVLWVAYHKGTSPVKTDINRDSINAYAKTIGLQGVAMISIDKNWSALRLKKI
jgi:predicted CoA-binding protein